MILEFFQWLQSTDFMTFIRESGLDISDRHEHAPDLHRDIRRHDRHHRSAAARARLSRTSPSPTSSTDCAGGSAWASSSWFAWGFTLFGSKAADYYPNPYFWIKMSLLVLIFIHAMIFRPLVYNHPEKLDASPVIPTRAKAAGALSLILWTGVVLRWTPDRLLRAAPAEGSYRHGRT